MKSPWQARVISLVLNTKLLPHWLAQSRKNPWTRSHPALVLNLEKWVAALLLYGCLPRLLLTRHRPFLSENYRLKEIKQSRLPIIETTLPSISLHQWKISFFSKNLITFTSTVTRGKKKKSFVDNVCITMDSIPSRLIKSLFFVLIWFLPIN